MPVFHFDIVDGARFGDPVVLDCANESDARKAADLIARQIAIDLDAATSTGPLHDAGQELRLPRPS
ncbi:hypothetical protein [Bradyrhizobium sp.]|uniref:DUF6894 family protein n=1 Tax=Bradyrhizobium sp. TaxID=376 RepID=UPI002722E0B6|nr:hypothetical protein [Bradyrhizobium sp.]MDO9294731.1 hypothetical protein [Bradyrhizobium sp.]